MFNAHSLPLLPIPSSNSLQALLNKSLRASYKYGAKYAHGFMFLPFVFGHFCPYGSLTVERDALLTQGWLMWFHQAGEPSSLFECQPFSLYTIPKIVKCKCLALLWITIVTSDTAWGCMEKQFCDVGSCWFLIKTQWKVLWECELNTVPRLDFAKYMMGVLEMPLSLSTMGFPPVSLP